MKNSLEWLKSSGIENLLNDVAQIQKNKKTQDVKITSSCISLAHINTVDQLKNSLEALTCDLKKHATNLVIGDGNKASKVIFIGEAPGAEEDEQGLPFVGQSGLLLNNILLAAGFKREEVYITNVIPWRPINNRTPSNEEIKNFRPYLLRHIEILNPKIIVTLGAIATKALLQLEEGILKLRGKWHNFNTERIAAEVMPTYHPSYLLRSPSQKKAVWSDFLKISLKFKSLID